MTTAISNLSPAGTTDAAPAFRLQIHRGREGFQRVRIEWDALLERLARPRFFQFSDWYGAYLDALEDRCDDVLFCLIHDANNEPAALLPLKSEIRSAGPIKLRTLELPRHDHLFLRDILISQEASERLSLACIARLLRRSELRWDMLCLWHVLDDSCVLAAQRAGMPRLAFAHKRYDCFYMPIEPWEQMMTRFSKNFRKQLRLAENRTASAGFRYEQAGTPEALDRTLPAFLQVEASGWKGAQGESTAIATDPKLVAFYTQLVRRFGQRRQCEIHMLYDGEKPVSGEFVLLDGHAAYAMKVGYDEQYARLSPGHALDIHVLKDYGQRPQLREWNLYSDSKWLEVWKPERMGVHNVYLFNRTPLGLAACAGMKWKMARSGHPG